MKVIWTEPARDRLAEVEEYIAQHSHNHAASFVLELMEETDKLAKFPESGRIVPEDENQAVRELIHEGYRILYKIEDGSVYILSVFEGSRLLRSDDLK